MRINGPMSSPAKKDRVQRAMTDDGAFRVMTARTTETVREVLQAQGVKGQLGRALGELVTAFWSSADTTSSFRS